MSQHKEMLYDYYRVWKQKTQRTTEKRVSRAKYGEFITSLFMSEISNYIYIVNHHYLFTSHILWFHAIIKTFQNIEVYSNIETKGLHVIWVMRSMEK